MNNSPYSLLCAFVRPFEMGWLDQALRVLRRKSVRLVLSLLAVLSLIAGGQIFDFFHNSFLAFSPSPKTRAAAAEQFYRTGLRLRYHDLNIPASLSLEFAKNTFERSESQLERPGVLTELLHVYRLLGDEKRATAVAEKLKELDPFVLQYYYLSCRGKYKYSTETVPYSCIDTMPDGVKRDFESWRSDCRLLAHNSAMVEQVLQERLKPSAFDYPYETALQIDYNAEQRLLKETIDRGPYPYIQCPGTVRVPWCCQLKYTMPEVPLLCFVVHNMQLLNERIPRWKHKATHWFLAEPRNVFETGSD